MLGDLFYSIQRYAQTGEQYYIIDDCELKIDDADALGEEDAGGVGKCDDGEYYSGNGVEAVEDYVASDGGHGVRRGGAGCRGGRWRRWRSRVGGGG